MAQSTPRSLASANAAQQMTPKETTTVMTSIGGSDAQDELFPQAYLRSLQAAGREAEAARHMAIPVANNSFLDTRGRPA